VADRPDDWSTLAKLRRSTIKLKKAEAEHVSLVIEAADEHFSLRAIAEAAGTDRMTVSRMLKRNGAT
jgi:IS30 family transposase